MTLTTKQLEVQRARSSLDGRRWNYFVSEGDAEAVVCPDGDGIFTVCRLWRGNAPAGGNGMVRNPKPIPGYSGIAFKKSAAIRMARKVVTEMRDQAFIERFWPTQKPAEAVS